MMVRTLWIVLLSAGLLLGGCDDRARYAGADDAGVESDGTGDTDAGARADTPDTTPDMPGDVRTPDAADARPGDTSDGSDGSEPSDTSDPSDSADAGDIGVDSPEDVDADTADAVDAPDADATDAPDADAGDAEDCEELACARDCSFGRWDDLDGCPTCACAAPPVGFSTGGRELDQVSLRTTPGLFIGGINRWLFDFVWLYDDPMVSDDTQQVELTVRWMQDVGMDPTEENQTFFMDDPGPVEAWGGTWTLFGFGVQTAPLTVESGFFSLRRVDGRFQGGVYLVLESGQQFPGQVIVGGPFDVPVPE